jgi:hypothetical protein
MPTSTTNIFRRVNRRRRCRICGKPDWCSYVRDESLSICMRVSDGARKINRHGGAIFIHDDWRVEKGIGVRVVADIPQSHIAPVEIRDFVYGRLIVLSPATLYPGALVAGEKGLLARGLGECHFGNYGGLPADSRERDRIARLLLQEINGHFSDAGSLHGVPGFWEDRQGVHLWKPKDYLLPRLLIPVRDGSGRIQACQTRLPFAAKKGLRYLWLSSSGLPHGTGSGSPLHFRFQLADLPRDAQIVIVEGVLKADVLSTIHPELYIVATPCVTANHGRSSNSCTAGLCGSASTKTIIRTRRSAFIWPRSSPGVCGAKERSQRLASPRGMLASKGLTTPRFAIFRSPPSASSAGSIASALGFDRSRWRVCLKSPHFHSERKTEAVRKDGDGVSPITARRVRPRIAGYHPVSGHLTKG